MPSSRLSFSQMSRMIRSGAAPVDLAERRIAVPGQPHAMALVRRGCRRSAPGCRARRPPPECRSSHAFPQLFCDFALLVAFPSVLRQRLRQHDPRPGAGPRIPFEDRRRHQLERPVVLLDDLLDDRQPEAGALRAMGDVGLEQPRRLVRQAGAVVDDVDDRAGSARPPARTRISPGGEAGSASSRSSIASAAFLSRLVKAWLIIVPSRCARTAGSGRVSA